MSTSNSVSLTTLSQKEYLKRYLFKGKKKPKKKTVTKSNVKVIDDNDLKTSYVEEDIDAEIGEDAPLVAAVIDERPTLIKKIEQFENSTRWAPIPLTNGENIKNNDDDQSKSIPDNSSCEIDSNSSEIKLSSEKQSRFSNDNPKDSTFPKKRKLDNYNTSPQRKRRRSEDNEDHFIPRKVDKSRNDRSPSTNYERSGYNDRSSPKVNSRSTRHRKSPVSGYSRNNSKAQSNSSYRKHSDNYEKTRSDTYSSKSISKSSRDKFEKSASSEKNFDSSKNYKYSRGRSPNRKISDSNHSKKRRELSPYGEKQKHSKPELSPISRSEKPKQYADKYSNPVEYSESDKYKNDYNNSSSTDKVSKSLKRVEKHHKSKFSGKRTQRDISVSSPEVSKHRSIDSPARNTRSEKHDKHEKCIKSKKYSDSDSDSFIKENDKKLVSDRSSSKKEKKHVYSSDESTSPRKKKKEKKKKHSKDSPSKKSKSKKKKKDREMSPPSKHKTKNESSSDEDSSRKSRKEKIQKSVKISSIKQEKLSPENSRGKKDEMKSKPTKDDEAAKKPTTKQYYEWGVGLKQIEDENVKKAEELHEMSKPLARYIDDDDLDKHLKSMVREGDTMLDYLEKKKIKNSDSTDDKPKYRGPFPLNRFGIPPGHKWDGVDRSNGYEKKFLGKAKQKEALQDEAYKWSTSDM